MSAPLSAGISIREFARREGCNEKLIRRAVKGGFLTALPDGTLAPALVGSGWRRVNRHADTGADTPADTADTVRTPMSAPGEVRAEMEGQPHGGALKRRRVPAGGDEDITLEEFSRRFTDGDLPSLALAEQVKAAALAQKQVLAAQQLAGSLIELEVAETALFNAARAWRDTWLNWPTRVGPLIAADLGVSADKVTEALNEHVHQQLADLGEPEADFTSDEA